MGVAIRYIPKPSKLKYSSSDVKIIKNLRDIFLDLTPPTPTLPSLEKRIKKNNNETLSSIMLDWFSHFYINKNSSTVLPKVTATTAPPPPRRCKCSRCKMHRVQKENLRRE